MGKVGRFACILTPMILTLASIICIAIVMIGQLSTKENKAPSTSLGRDLYFFKADTTGFTAGDSSFLDKIPTGTHFDPKFLEDLKSKASAGDLKAFYQVGLWSYCSGDKDKTTGAETITYCSPSKSNFWFDPFEVWGLKNTTFQEALGDDKLQNGLNAYKKATGWMVWAYGIALVLAAAEFIIGFFAIFSRWGSLVTTIVSTAQTVFIIAAAATSTTVYGVLTGVFETALEPIKIEPSMGTKMLSVVWLAVAFSLASGLFWLFSVCCCSGKSPHKKVKAEKTPYTYERVASPAFPAQHQQNSYQMTPQHGQPKTAYEPFRGHV